VGQKMLQLVTRMSTSEGRMPAGSTPRARGILVSHVGLDLMMQGLAYCWSLLWCGCHYGAKPLIHWMVLALVLPTGHMSAGVAGAWGCAPVFASSSSTAPVMTCLASTRAVAMSFTGCRMTRRQGEYARWGLGLK
jgi:hypothetical protein